MERNGVVIPLQLDTVRQMLPGKVLRGDGLEPGQAGLQCTVYGYMACACSSTCITVKEGNITNTGPAIFNQCGGMELRHNDMVLNYFSKLRKNLHRTSECVRFWTDAVYRQF